MPRAATPTVPSIRVRVQPRRKKRRKQPFHLWSTYSWDREDRGLEAKPFGRYL